MLIKNNSIKLLTFIMIFVFSGITAEISAQNSWLDATRIQNWNRTVDTIPKIRKNSRADLRRCSRFVRQPRLPEDFLLTNNGHILTGAALVHGTTSLITVAGGFDFRCRPMVYQTYVFSEGKLAGTISPEPMNWQKDGSSVDLITATEDYLAVKFARYRETDDFCCPSSTKTVVFQIKKSGKDRSILVPTGSFENSYYDSYLPSYSADDLKKGVWRWQNILSADDLVEVDKPENYTIEFAPNGQLKVRADCNQGFGKYKANDGVIALTEIATTRRACSPESMDSAFLSNLKTAIDFRIEADTLVLELPDNKEMVFSRAENKNVNMLEKTSWFWESSNDSESEIAVDEPKKYQISFALNGELLLVSDCNRGGGKYEVKDDKLKISSTFLTLMSCGEDSLGSRFAQQLEGNKTFRIEKDYLIVEDADGKNTMRFIRGRD